MERNAESAADYEEITELGRQDPKSQWILSCRDSFYINPFYNGPDQPHPETDDRLYEDDTDPMALAALVESLAVRRLGSDLKNGYISLIDSPF